MVKPLVHIEVFGAEEVEKYLKDKTKEVQQRAAKAAMEAGFYMVGEVKESIAGQRDEPRSVDTGRFLNSVTMGETDDGTVVVYTDVEYAEGLEYGTTRLAPRRHFNNSADRNREKIKKFYEIEISNV